MTAARHLPVRGMRRTDAARYIGVSPSTFDKWIEDGKMPRGRPVDGCVLWDLRELDAAFDDLLHGNDGQKPAMIREPQL